MLILGIDTSFSETSVAVTGAGKMAAHTFRKNPRHSHSASLLGLIETALDESDRAIYSFDAIAVTNGPGSFTGVRTGIATAMGIADASGVRLAGVGTLDAIVEAHIGASKGVWPWLCAILHARKGEVYSAFFRQIDGSYEKQGDDIACGPSELGEMIAGPTLFIGDGFLPYAETIAKKSDYPIDHVETPSRPVACGAASLVTRTLNDKAGDITRPAPKYVKKPQAVLNWEKLHT